MNLDRAMIAPEDKERYAKMHANLFNSVKKNSDKIEMTQEEQEDILVTESIACIIEQIKSGIHPSYLDEEEKNALKSVYGDEWYRKWGFEEVDLYDIVNVGTSDNKEWTIFPAKTETPKISLLISHIWDRKDYLEELLEILTKQQTDEVEIIVYGSYGEKGYDEVSGKRNRLLEKATGDYICYIDDDDLVSYDYVSTILSSLEINNDPSCTALVLGYFLDGLRQCYTSHSMIYQEWSDTSEEGTIPYEAYRYPNHLNPVKRDLALQVKFDEVIGYGEDKDYSTRLQSLLENEGEVEKEIYFYLKYSEDENKESIQKIRKEFLIKIETERRIAEMKNN